MGLIIEEGVVEAGTAREARPKAPPALSAEARLAVCRRCPIYVQSTGLCDPSRWLDPKTGDWSRVRRQGWVRGCGCLIDRKTRNPSAHCVAGKW